MRPIVEPAGRGALRICRRGMTTDERAALLAVVGLGLAAAAAIGWAWRSPEDGRLWFVGGAACGLVGLVALGGVLVRNASPCTWRIDAAGVEVCPAAGPERRIGWVEVGRVRWWPDLVILDGPAGRITLPRMTLPAADWATVRDRVEAALGSRFDLTVRPPDVRFRPGRVLAVLAPFGLAAAWFARALPTLTIPQMHAGVWTMMALLVAPLPWLAWRSRTEQERRNLSWRRPRATDQARARP